MLPIRTGSPISASGAVMPRSLATWDPSTATRRRASLSASVNMAPAPIVKFRTSG
jgi:hypothetical protein